jgi:hydroxymethylbilane synthase
VRETPDRPLLRLGSRGSPLALWQAGWIRDRLLGGHPGLAVELVVMRTRAESFPERALEEIGSGIFTREFDTALIDRRIDIAVHSLKDIPSAMPRELMIAAVPERESPLDALVSAGGVPLAALAPGARVGTGSPRRKAQLLALRPDLEVVPLRGNVDTRLGKIATGGLAGTILAYAGLKRLGKEAVISEVLDPARMVPAVGQGALAVSCRVDDAATRRLLEPLEHPPSRLAIEAERSFLRRLEGGCQVPAGALATLEGTTLRLAGVLAAPDGSISLRGELSGDTAGALRLGEELADDLLRRGGDRILRRVRGR